MCTRSWDVSKYLTAATGLIYRMPRLVLYMVAQVCIANLLVLYKRVVVSQCQGVCEKLCEILSSFLDSDNAGNGHSSQQTGSTPAAAMTAGTPSTQTATTAELPTTEAEFSAAAAAPVTGKTATTEASADAEADAEATLTTAIRSTEENQTVSEAVSSPTADAAMTAALRTAALKVIICGVWWICCRAGFSTLK